MRLPVLWLTGRPGSGKTTLAAGLSDALRNTGIRVECLDAADLDAALGTPPDAESADRRLAWLTQLIARNGAVSIVVADPADGPAADRARNAIPNLIEVFVDTPRDVCVQRAGRRATIDFVEPIAADIRVLTHDRDPRATVAQVVSQLDLEQLRAEPAVEGRRPWASAGM
jgi:hypothetical protein